MEITSPSALAASFGLPLDIAAASGSSPLTGEEAPITGAALAGSSGPLPGGPVAPAFGEVLSGFLNQVDGTQHQADAMVESLALGEPVDVHQVMLALNEATDALHLTLTVRGKVLDAYQELMRMPM